MTEKSGSIVLLACRRHAGREGLRAASRRRRRRVVTALALVAGWALVAAVLSPAEIIDRVVASIDGDPITQSEVEFYVREHGVSGGPSREALAALVTERLLDEEAKARGIRIGSEEIDQYIAGVKLHRGLDDAAFELALRERGMTIERYRNDVQAELEKAELIDREIRGRVSVSPEEVRRHYDKNADDYNLAERVELRMIMIPVAPDAMPMQLAQAEMVIRVLHARLQAGEDFAELARSYSAGPGASEGGYLGVFERGQMVEPLEQAAFSLRAGTLSDPIRSAAGFHLLKVERREGSIEQPFEEVADQIREELYEDALQRRYERWIREDLREAHHVEILWGEDES